MHILCIFDHLPIPGKAHRKEGVYPVFVKIHTRCGFKTGVGAVKLDDIQEHSAMCDHYGANFIAPNGLSFRCIAKYVIVAVKNSISERALLSLHNWLFFVFKNHKLLSGIEEYIAKNGKPDIVSGLTSIEKSGRMAFLIGKRHRIPYTVRENRTDYTRGLIKGIEKRFRVDVVRSAAAVFPVSPPLGENMKVTLEMDIPQMIPLQNPVADFFFQKPKQQARWIHTFADNRFIFAGWINWRDIKRIDIALRAFAKVYQINRKTCLILAGPVPEWTDSMIDDLKIRDAVRLTDSLDRQKIHDLAHGCDCCLVPSDHDPGNNSVLEAMAAGKPSIVTKCGGSESRITDKSIGLVVQAGSVEQFSRAMEEILEDYSSFDSQHISTQAVRLYSEQAFAATLVKAYHNLSMYSSQPNSMQKNIEGA